MRLGQVGWCGLRLAAAALECVRTRQESLSARAWVVLFSSVLAAGAARAQSCEPVWVGRFPRGDLSTASEGIVSFTTFDDGTGPALYASGEFDLSGSPVRNVGRWNGREWQPVGIVYTGQVNAIAAGDAPEGPSLYAGGGFTVSVQPVRGGSVARLVGGRWLPLPEGPSGLCTSLVVWNRNVYAAGTGSISKWDGHSWTVLGSGFEAQLAIHDDGTGQALFAAGSGVPGNVARWSGSAWTPIASSVAITSATGIHSLKSITDADGPALWMGGEFSRVDGLPCSGIAVWRSGHWQSPGTGVPGGTVFAVEQSGGGSRTSIAAAGWGSVWNWDGQHWSPLGTSFDHPVQALCWHDDGSGAGLFAGGRFTRTGQTPANLAARWRNGAWSGLSAADGGLDGPVNAIATVDAGDLQRLVVGGRFTRAGSTEASNLAQWDGQAWTSLGGGVSGQNSGVASLLTSVQSGRETLYVAGNFESAGGTPAHNFAVWNGTEWSTLGFDGGPISAMAFLEEAGGRYLFAGARWSVTQWDGVSWSPIGQLQPNPGGSGVESMAAFDDGHGAALYISGQVQLIGEDQWDCVLRWSGSEWVRPGEGIRFRVAHALAVFDDGGGPALYVGGDFASAGGMPAANVARWDGRFWSAVGEGLPTLIEALAVADLGDGPALYAAASTIYRWRSGHWEQVRRVSGGVSSIKSAAVGPAPRLYIGGRFTSVNDWATGLSSSNLAALGCGSTCYANCDGSSTAPILDALDFICFAREFALRDPRANCDGSTALPVLTTADFVCFMSRFAEGCP